MTPPSSLQTARTTVKRRAQRAAYDRTTVDAILDEGLVCHVGFVVERQPYVLPTIYARVGCRLYLHRSTTKRTTRLRYGPASSRSSSSRPRPLPTSDCPRACRFRDPSPVTGGRTTVAGTDMRPVKSAPAGSPVRIVAAFLAVYLIWGS